MRRLAGGPLIAAMVGFLAVAGVCWLLWDRCGLRGCPAVDRLDGYVPDRAAVVVDRHGVELARLYVVQRKIVPLDSLPPYVPAAFIAIEDQRFWEHGGIDWRRTFGAALANLKSLRIRQGFSTITMQLARNAFPDRLPYAERTIGRKLAEMRVAKAIEARYTKRQILGLYLNHIYFGGGAWGIEAAAQEYFRKPASALTLAEAALLAGMVTAPNDLDPRRYPERAYKRRWVVLHAMWRQGVITAESANAADDAPLVTAEGTAEAGELAPYFVQEVRHYMEREIGEALYTAGYTIHTTLDAAAQAAAQEELRERLEAVESGRYGPYRHPVYRPGVPRDPDGTKYLQGAVVVLDAATGDVLAMVGGRDFSHSRFNRAVGAWRQPASTFKPFVYAAALALGYSPAHRLDNSRIRRNMGGGRVWSPRNFNGRYAESISLRDALVVSSNTATIRLAEAVGFDRVAAVAERLGLRGPFPRVPSLALGTAEATPLELAAAYTAFATLGDRAEPRIVTRVRAPDGRVVWRREPRVEAVLDPGVAFLLTDILRDVVDRGTGFGVRMAGFRGPAAGKTGTSNDAADYWFVGYTPSRVATVWIGFDLPRTIIPGASGDRIAPPLWGRIMRRIAPRGERPWAPPPTVRALRVDDAGRIYAPECGFDGAGRSEYFLAATVARVECGEPYPVPAVADLPAGDSLAIPTSGDRATGR
ncbi:MAG TPA: PBP1A family penicillin-binding protein [Longimicrobiales bacterium]